ncbi:four-carbon acid sugar kinase family protein [Vibrio sp. CDRSL-10 TSBA]
MLRQGQLPLPKFIVADDFTGANDVGVGLAAHGIDVSVLLNSAYSSDVAANQATIICTDSRDDSAAHADDKMRQLMQRYPELTQQKILLKKIDSTLRGNVGAEIAPWVESCYSVAIMVMCAPNAGRKTIGGECFVHDQLLTETEFASDPKSPVTSARIKTLIESQSHLAVSELFLDQVRAPALTDTLQARVNLGTKVIVCDAQTAQDMIEIYQAANQLSTSCVIVTTGEMTQALLPSSAQHQPVQPKLYNQQPLLGVVGSMSRITLSQVQYLQTHHRAEVIDVDVKTALFAENQDYLHSLVAAIAQAHQAGRHCFIRTCQSNDQRHDIETICAQLTISRPELGNRVKQFLAQTTQEVLRQCTPGALLLCGGDIALAVCHQLKIGQFNLKGLSAQCIPWGILPYKHASIPLFTKAGGFGVDSSFDQIITILEQEEA